MAEPEYEDILDEQVNLDEQEITPLINWTSALRGSVGYWKGKVEGLEIVVAHLRADRDGEVRRLTEAHERVLKQMAAENELTIGYLEGRLNRLEAKASPQPKAEERPCN